jgi:hypothetical protein
MKIELTLTDAQEAQLRAQLDPAQGAIEAPEPTPGLRDTWERIAKGPIHNRGSSGDLWVLGLSMTETNEITVTMPGADFFADGKRFWLRAELHRSSKDWAHRATWSDDEGKVYNEGSGVTLTGPRVGAGRAGKTFTLSIDSLSPTGNGKVLMDIYLEEA